MIDLHNHILPAVDDGAADITETIAIARQFVDEGVRCVTATPHYDPLHGGGPSADEVRQLVGEVRLALASASVPLEICTGHELLLTPDAVDLLNAGTVATLGGSRFVLVEVSLTALERPLYLDDTLFRLQIEGFHPILAHPERYAFVQRDPESVDNLISRGVILQLTAPALIGEYGGAVRKTAVQLLQRAAYSLAASDRHHPGPKRSLAQMAERLAALQPDEDLATLLLSTNPARVLDNREPIAPDPLPRRNSLLGRLFGVRS
jgi:protein-tyrosine phosphatase